MTEEDFYKEFIDWLESEGVIDVNDMNKFVKWYEKQAQYNEAKKFIDKNG